MTFFKYRTLSLEDMRPGSSSIPPSASSSVGQISCSRSGMMHELSTSLEMARGLDQGAPAGGALRLATRIPPSRRLEQFSAIWLHTCNIYLITRTLRNASRCSRRSDCPVCKLGRFIPQAFKKTPPGHRRFQIHWRTDHPTSPGAWTSRAG